LFLDEVMVRRKVSMGSKMRRWIFRSVDQNSGFPPFLKNRAMFPCKEFRSFFVNCVGRGAPPLIVFRIDSSAEAPDGAAVENHRRVSAGIIDDVR
jgi:hypothetical protein